MTSAPASPDLGKVSPSILAPAITPTRLRAASEVRGPSLVQIVTLVIWFGCLGAGGLGLTLHYSRPQPAPPTPVPIQAEILNVELVNDPLPPPDVAPPPAPTKPPPLTPPPTLPPSPPMMAVAEPSPAIAFPLPVEGPARVVEARVASPAVVRTPEVAPAAAPSVETLTYGVGEGRQPAPGYPPRALREGQEGKVTVRFHVDENGRVLGAEAVSRSPWPLLNAEAVRVIRERWQFRPGTARLYEVSIHFQLRK